MLLVELHFTLPNRSKSLIKIDGSHIIVNHKCRMVYLHRAVRGMDQYFAEMFLLNGYRVWKYNENMPGSKNGYGTHWGWDKSLSQSCA